MNGIPWWAWALLIRLLTSAGRAGRRVTGLGYWVQSLQSLSDDKIRLWHKRDGLRHLVLQSVWESSSGSIGTYSTSVRHPGTTAPYGSGPELDRRTELARSLGIACVPFGWPRPVDQGGRPDRVAGLLAWFAARWGSSLVVLDVEDEQGIDWTPPRVQSTLVPLVSDLRSIGLRVGISTIGVPWYHPGIPWQALAPLADEWWPQTYYVPGTQGLPANYPSRVAQELRAFSAGAGRSPVLRGSVFTSSRTVSEIGQTAAAVWPAMPGSLTAWKASTTSDAEASALGTLVRQLEGVA